MARSPQKNVIPQMFDVRPVNRSGEVDWDRIHRIDGRRVVSLSEEVGSVSSDADNFSSDISEREADAAFNPGYPSDAIERSDEENFLSGMYEDFRETIGRFFSRKTRIGMLGVMALSCFIAGGAVFLSGKASEVRSDVLGESVEGVKLSLSAIESLKRAEFEYSSQGFQEAHASFARATEMLGGFGNRLAKIARFIPGLSKVSSGQGMLEGAQHLSLAGAELSGVLALTKQSFVDGKVSKSLLSFLEECDRAAEVASREIALAEESFARVNPSDLPEDRVAMFLSLHEKLPIVRGLLSGFHEQNFLLHELLGGNGERIYLFLFQNNHELRPTGGFIGSYGLLKISEGEVRKFLIDGIFDPDGQLRVNVVPPKPIQKISAGWSLHDSNYWPDFPRSAEKAMYFYEKTGGPTVDGVVTFTPSVIIELLRVTGPIEMPEYGVTISADNFMEAIQEEVEVKYDKEENEPKKILADFAPKLFDRLFHIENHDAFLRMLEVLGKGLDEKHILLYSRNEDIESRIQEAGWGGEMLATDGDYLSVVHTNINGYKTDGVIDEEIMHYAEIQADGSVIDTVRVTRSNRGGETPYEWWNKVNADYLRVYVPKGSELLTMKGATWEFPEAPIDYDALGFLRDPEVETEERGTVIHETGTRISEESGKTVFGNWVYVSPGESVTVEYRYRLPFHITLDGIGATSYSLLVQKQAGTPGSDFRSTLLYPKDRLAPSWETDGAEVRQGSILFSKPLVTDRFFGAVFERN